MNLFDLPNEEFEKTVDNFLDSQTKEDIMYGLVKNGMELSNEDKAKWIDPIYINTEKELEKLLDAFEKAAKASHKLVDVNYKNVTIPEEIKEIFKKM